MTVASAHLNRAHEKLDAARDLLTKDHAEDSVSRAYYATFHAATAALVAAGEAPKSHKGVQQQFWVRFVESGRISRQTGSVLARAREMRSGADYDAFMHFDTMAADDLLNDATAFVEVIEALVQELRVEG